MTSQDLVRKFNVLAVDDNPANLIALEAVLAQDCNLVSASSGHHALEILRARNDIDVILMDIQMPEMDGFETMKEIKKIPSCMETPVIFITAIYKEEPFVRKGYELGAVDYFSKPFDPEILRTKVAIYGTFRQKEDLLRERERQAREGEELISAGHKISTFLKKSPVAILIVDVEGRVVQTSGNVARVCGVQEPSDFTAYEGVLGWHSKESMRKSHGVVAKALQHGETSLNEAIELLCWDGSLKRVMCSTSPLFNLRHEIRGAVAVIHDLTEQKLVEEDIRNRILKYSLPER